MPLTPKVANSYERILACGNYGVGKSFSYYTVARLAQNTGSDAKFFVIDADNSFARMVSDPAFENLTNLVPFEIGLNEGSEWLDLMEVVGKVREQVRPQDWTMIDLFSPTWDWAQDEYIQSVLGHDPLEFRTKVARKELKMEGADWQIIKSMYGKLQNKVLRWPGHLYCTNAVKAVKLENMKPEHKQDWAREGKEPIGNKHNPFLFQTVLLMTWDRSMGYVAKTIKDRSRERMEQEVMTDFSVSYLVNRGGWSIT